MAKKVPNRRTSHGGINKMFLPKKFELRSLCTKSKRREIMQLRWMRKCAQYMPGRDEKGNMGKAPKYRNCVSRELTLKVFVNEEQCNPQKRSHKTDLIVWIDFGHQLWGRKNPWKAKSEDFIKKIVHS